MTTPNSLLIVDDDPDVINVLQLYIESEGHQVITAVNGADALKKLDEHGENIQAVISDVMMPVLDGYGFCEKLRADERFQGLPFIFISTLTNMDEKLKGYGYGADEYISKPIAPQELIFKTRNIIENKIKHESLSKQLSESFNAAMQAMSYSSYLGQTLLFLQEATNATSFDEVATLLFETMNGLGLNSVIQFHINGELKGYRKDKENITPLESNIMELSRKESRFFDFGTRTIINYDDFSLLIKNMPTDNPESYGTLKDVLGNLCNAIEAVTKILLSREETRQKNATMNMANGAIDKIEQSLHTIQTETEDAINSMMDDIEDAMITLGLLESQEEAIRTIVRRCRERSNKAFEKGQAVYDSFAIVHDTLSNQ